MLNEIVLINNDKYGAPELKKLYQGYTLKGFIIAVTLHIGLIAGYMLTVYINESKAKDIPRNPNERVIWVDDILPPPIEEQEIPPVKEEITDKVKDLASLEPKPVRKDIADDVVMKTQDELNNIDANTSREGDSLIASNNIKIDDSKIDDRIKNITETDNKTYEAFNVEVAPECINLAQVKASMQYPELALETGEQGKVTVRVLVGPDGNVIKIGAVNRPDVFHDEVKDKAQDLSFTPGLQNNKPVKVWVTVPFNFKLK